MATIKSKSAKSRARSGSPPAPLLTFDISSWQQFQEIVAGPRFRNWAFRGQGDAEWPLHSSLSRYVLAHGIHRDAWSSQEERIGRIFRRKAHLFLEHIPDEGDNFQWLALMQHHGAPTRLLDFTWSPYVAAFFALERATRDAAIWAIFIPALWREERTIRFPRLRRTMRADEIGLRRPGAYEEYYLGNHVPFVSSGEPVVMNKRLIAQSGTFVVPGLLDQPIDEFLASYVKGEAAVVTVVVNATELRAEAMRALYWMNLRNATLLPDLDDLARSLACELEFQWAFDPRTFVRNPRK